MSSLKDILEKRIDTPPPLFLKDELTLDQEKYLSEVYEKAFHCSILSPSHSNTQPVRFAFFEEMNRIKDLFLWLDNNYSKEFKPGKYNSLSDFHGSKVKRVFIPIYKVLDRDDEKKSNPEWESQATASIAVNNACVSLNQSDPFITKDGKKIFPSIHWWSQDIMLPYSLEYLYQKNILERDVKYGSLGIMLGGFISEEIREKFYFHPKHQQKLSIKEFVLKV